MKCWSPGGFGCSLVLGLVLISCPVMSIWLCMRLMNSPFVRTLRSCEDSHINLVPANRLVPGLERIDRKKIFDAVSCRSQQVSESSHYRKKDTP